LVGETIASLFAQTCADWELVVVDDCSTDDTLSVLRSYDDPRIRVFAAEANGGPVVTRNRAFAEARGRYIAALDQDDLATPDRFARQVAFLDAHPDFVAVGSAATLLMDGRHLPWPHERSLTPAQLDWALLTRNPLVWSSVMIRADAARQLDPFERPELRYAEDFDLYQRLRKLGRIARLDAPLTVYRSHAGGASKKYEMAMMASAGRVLAERYAPILADGAQAGADIVLRHVMDGQPVADAAALARVFGVIQPLHDHLIATGNYTDAERAEIDEEYSRLWWRVTRIALRSHSLKLRELIATRPANVTLYPTDRTDRLLSPLVGRVRSIQRSLKGTRA
jgi:glycosyltransferase involved in cell wall biosynthesis